jgi:cell division transport system permease protein
MKDGSFQSRLITLKRIVRAGAVNFVRNITLSVAATAVMVVTLTIVLFSIIANATFNNTISQINDKIDISIYLKDEVDEEKTEAFITKLKGLQNVREVTFVSKEVALENYQRENQDNLELQLAISQTDNPLPATIQVKPHDPERIEEIRTLVETTEFKEMQSEETSYSGDRKEAIDKITNATSFFKKAVFVGIVVFAIISMLIIFNTIQMAIFNRRDELTIMRLLGASNWYIKGPFIVETMIYGVVAAVISLSLCNALFVVQAQAFDASSLGLLDIQYANQYYSDHFLIFLVMQLVAGVAIGAISALIATSRYLRVKPNKIRK